MPIPTIFSWPLIVPSLPSPGSGPTWLAPGAGTAVCNPEYLTEADLLAVLGRILPEWYLAPLIDPGPGYELFQAYAKMLERVSLAIGRFECSSFVVYSHGGSLATASVEFYRQNSSAGAFTVKQGTICRTSKTNRSFEVVEDVVFGGSDLVVAGQVRAVGPGFEYNVAGPFSTADGTVLPGEIDTVAIPILDPVYGEPTIQVRQIADATGGQPAVLDQLGLDRNLGRLPQEPDDIYKGRIRQLPDTVSPDALRNQLDAVFLPLGLEYQLIETWENAYQSCWDAPLGDIPNVTMGTLEEDTFAYDDPRNTPDVPFRGRWLDERDHMGGIVVVVPNITSWEMRGMAYDDDGAAAVLAPDSFTTALGRRATSAYDAPDQDSDEILVPFYDGDDRLKNLFYMRLWDLLRQTKGGGTNVAIELQGE